MLALESQMKRLQEWRDTGYFAKVCADNEHTWGNASMRITLGGRDNNVQCVVVSSTCKACGIKKDDTYYFEHTRQDDEWSDFREGGEEE
jgi:hypothetical protein